MTTVVCVASGPSLTRDQTQTVESARQAGRCRVIVVNDNYRLLPDADVLYAADARWWRHHWPAVRETFRGECWTCHGDAAREFGLCQIRGDSRGRGLSRDPSVINTGNNSGYQAIGLAYHFGASRILLIGYDMQHLPGDAPHWFGKHPEGFSNAAGVAQWAPAFRQLADDLRAEGVPLVNCSLRTALPIPRGDLKTELERECLPA